ncbi:hypothetical protein HMPREF1332_01038 [Enterococcus faecalis ERV31]|nr:hypothetical protein HMPREF1332_01038 [Enterococcus faecalis ERV31]
MAPLSFSVYSCPHHSLFLCILKDELLDLYKKEAFTRRRPLLSSNFSHHSTNF